MSLTSLHPPQERVLLAYIFCLTSHDGSLTYWAKFSVRMLLFYEIIYFILFHIFCKKCIAAIACAEIPNRQWLEVVDILQNIAVQPTSADSLREQALEAIGYLCQDIVSTLFINCQPFKPSLLQMQVPFQRKWLIELQERGDVEIFRKTSHQNFTLRGTVSVTNYYQKRFLHSEVNAELVTLLFEKDLYWHILYIVNRWLKCAL